MFWNRKKEVVKKHVVEPKKQEEFKIPQIPDDNVGLRVNKNKFTKTMAVSPMEGPYTKDVVVVPEFEGHDDLDLAYDPFREEKRLKEEDEIKRYGRKYHEFQSVDGLLDTTEYAQRKEKLKEEKGQIGINFGVVCDVNDVLTKQERVMPKTEERIDLDLPRINPNIFFAEPKEEKVETDIEFKPINVNNEIKEEQEDIFIKPVQRVFDFPQTYNPKPIIDESVPKTIIVSKPRVYEEEQEETPNIPPFINEVKNDYNEVKILETPEVKIEEKNIYEEIRNKNPEKIIVPDKYKDYKYPPVSLLNPVNTDAIVEPEWIQDKIESML